jgi:CubicO group peptidase (beta-lactamase class C family)
MTAMALVAPGFEAVAEAFAQNFATRGDVGAAVCVYVDGSPVVDLVGGVADPATRTPYTDDTLQFVFSTTKGVTALVVHGLVENGVLDLDAPIAEVWPEFAQHGKGAISLRWVLGHRAGVPILDGSFTLDALLDPERVDAALEAQSPLWEPNSQHGYHAVTYGWIIDGVLRRVTGKPVRAHVQERIVDPLGLDLWLCLPESEFARVAPVIDMSADELALMAAVFDDDHIANRAVYINGALTTDDGSLIWNDTRLWQAAWPAVTCVTNARSLARMYAATVSDVDGVQLLKPATVDACRTELSFGPDASTFIPSRFGHGFHLHHDGAPLLGPSSFGHGGMGGSQAFADVDHRVGFAYVMNQMQLMGDRAKSLVDSVRACL